MGGGWKGERRAQCTYYCSSHNFTCTGPSLPSAAFSPSLSVHPIPEALCSQLLVSLEGGGRCAALQSCCCHLGHCSAHGRDNALWGAVKVGILVASARVLEALVHCAIRAQEEDARDVASIWLPVLPRGLLIIHQVHHDQVGALCQDLRGGLKLGAQLLAGATPGQEGGGWRKNKGRGQRKNKGGGRKKEGV